jgi:hypothetical protein
VLNHVAKPSGIERDDWRLAQERFDCDQTEPFVCGGDNYGRGALVKPWQL